jgi:hypothetical protein
MKTLFSMSPFAQPGFVPAFSAPREVSGLGQTAEDITGLSKGIEEILKMLPASSSVTYQQQYQDCQKKLNTGGLVGVISGGKCLYDLYQSLKRMINAPPAASPPPAAVPASFPVLPAAITAVGGLVLVFGLSKL